jgi:subtilisin family serine protease
MMVLLSIFFLQFTDKVGAERVCLSPTAMEMREARGIAIDSLDYEVSPIYLDSVQALGASVLHTSRWMNGATVQASEEVIEVIKACEFVESVEKTRVNVGEAVNGGEAVNVDEAGEQLDQLNLLPLHQAGYKGRGIRIGIADGGFYRANSMLSLPQDQCLGYADLTDEKEDIFGSSGSHGTMCLSTIMATQVDYTGAATEAEYYLFRTEEEYTESPKEIDNWVAAIEMADSMGLHIVSTSLGYTTFDDAEMDLQYADMDGRTSRAAQSAVIAARKGMLLVVAAGNDGNKAWHYISAPGDADNILTIGAVNIHNNIAAFSSWGPTADGRVKPEVCATGSQTALINPMNNSVTYGNGTSFACPIIAGMAACLWSAMPHATNMEIRERIIQSADRYTQPHEQYGYGIPNAWQAYAQTTDLPSIPNNHVPTAQKVLINGQLWILHNGEKYNVMGNKVMR